MMLLTVVRTSLGTLGRMRHRPPRAGGDFDSQHGQAPEKGAEAASGHPHPSGVPLRSARGEARLAVSAPKVSIAGRQSQGSSGQYVCSQHTHRTWRTEDACGDKLLIE